MIDCSIVSGRSIFCYVNYSCKESSKLSNSFCGKINKFITTLTIVDLPPFVKRKRLNV